MLLKADITELAVLFIGISFLVGVSNEFLPQEKAAVQKPRSRCRQ